MSNFEEILKYSEKPKQVAKYFHLFSSQLYDNEEILRIVIEHSISPKALIITNQRVLECKCRDLATDIAIKFNADWNSVRNVSMVNEIGSVNYIFGIGDSNTTYKCIGYEEAGSEETFRLMQAKIQNTLSAHPQPLTPPLLS